VSERNLAVSVRARLLNRAREAKQDFNLVLTRYAIERLLYRIGISKHADLFLLKGALLFDLWFDLPHRPTRDADFLGFGSSELPHIEHLFREICSIQASDGIAFQADTVRAAEIRKEAHYAGVRVTLLGLIDGARCQVQVDIGFGDAVTPAPEITEYPVILPGIDAPKLRVYPRYTVVAEKFEALTSLGIANSRMKDYFDLWVLASHTDFDGEVLCRAIQATFGRRKTTLPDQTPFGLTAAFAQDRQKQMQWQAFLRKNQLDALLLEEVVSALAGFLMPVVHAAITPTAFPSWWPAGGHWSPASPR
jgi:hypothetical protein